MKACFIYGLLASNVLFAGNSSIPCPVPSSHMKPYMFTVNNKSAETYLKSNQTGFTWHVTIRTDSLVLNNASIEPFLRANKYQETAYDSPGGIGQARYTCSYINPYPYKAEFFAVSDGTR